MFGVEYELIDLQERLMELPNYGCLHLNIDEMAIMLTADMFSSRELEVDLPEDIIDDCLDDPTGLITQDILSQDITINKNRIIKGIENQSLKADAKFDLDEKNRFY